jgi:uncharacterized protein YuzE
MRMSDVLVETDLGTGATYYVLTANEVAHTWNASEMVSVDIDEQGQAVGVEFAAGVTNVADQDWHAMYDRFPMLKEVFYNVH